VVAAEVVSEATRRAEPEVASAHEGRGWQLLAAVASVRYEMNEKRRLI
jgi:hypothetical protein